MTMGEMTMGEVAKTTDMTQKTFTRFTLCQCAQSGHPRVGAPGLNVSIQTS
jgi:hypothetical protein